MPRRPGRAGPRRIAMAGAVLALWWLPARAQTAPPAAGPPPAGPPPAGPAPAGHSDAEFERMTADLKRSLAAHPDDADRWVLLARSLATLRHWDDALDAFGHAITLRPNVPALQAQLGEVLTLRAGGTVTPDAKAAFDKAQDDPRSRFYLALAVAQDGDPATAIKRLQALRDEAPPEAPWRQLVVDELQALQTDGASAPATAAPRQTARLGDEIRSYLSATRPSAPAAPPADPAGEISTLETRLRGSPQDPAGWRELARLYQAAGNAPQAVTALRRANQANPANLDLLLAYADVLADARGDERLADDFVDVMRQVHALDANQPDALWYLGLHAAQHGDTYRARKLWRQLADELPAGGPDRKTVEERLDTLR